MDKYYN